MYMANAAPTRRLTTIVAADVAGYSRLTAADEEGTLDALRTHRAELIDPKISEYDGRIANTAGDSLLIEFGSVVNALRAALEIQAGMAARNADVPPERRIEFRVGVFWSTPSHSKNNSSTRAAPRKPIDLARFVANPIIRAPKPCVPIGGSSGRLTDCFASWSSLRMSVTCCLSVLISCCCRSSC